jgi:hypothetical protein
MTGTFSCHRFSCHLKTNHDDNHVFIFAPSRLCAFAQEPQSATNLPATSEAFHQAKVEVESKPPVAAGGFRFRLLTATRRFVRP